ncbi:transcription factor [Trichoderma cornu-damae]|uniref:Transcription factor n=1 Tax=Trichoderma cornu-damae TaxID=654480 RepID=A0A9P8QQ92_9HYPO|nr:transcription factor [Trichoderma cornu-damae]
MASIYQPRPVLPCEGIPHAPEYVEARRSVHGARQPLREATGNAQAHSFNGTIPCYPTPVSSIPPTIPIVPSQLDSLYRYQTHRHQPRQARKGQQELNPLYYWPAFKQYRNRQAHKDTQKDKGGVWRRPELEDAFVDSVLLMPHMGRRKFSMGGKLHGRNMLISEYIFVICVEVLGSKEIFRIDNSNDSIEQMGRKQVSSHMQVVKKFFEDLRCFHFLFPSEEKKEPGSTNSDDYFDEEEQESFKSNPILTALAEGRVPDVRPNYDYFTQLLSLQSSISVRPKTCEIYVSSAEIKIRDDVAYDKDNNPLDQASFPHLNKYTSCDDFPDVLGKDVLLHEYTRALDRATSACMKTVTRRWQKDSPAMYETLDLPARDQDCLLLEMCSTLELHEHAKFPSGSELIGCVEVAITQPGLQHHHWKCVTRLTRPDELHSEDSKRGVYTNESGIHLRGCSDSKNDCICHMRPRQEIHVPFPAVEWASILSTAVQYPDVEHQRKKEKRHESKKQQQQHQHQHQHQHQQQQQQQQQHDPERAGSKRKRSEDEGDAASWGRREPTGSDLICKVAMYQELWSRAPDSSQWKRQAIIFWRFNTTNQWYKYSPVFKPSGTSWRWLTINDPMSRYHQQKALVYPSATVPRDAVMSPTPSVNQQLAGMMNENLSSAWNSGGVGVPQVAQVPPVQTNINVFDFPTGLATPPPTAAIHGPYAGGSFDPNLGANPDVNGYLPTVSTTVGGVANERSHSLSLAHGPSYFEGQAGFADMKPMTTAGVGQYLAATTAASLDLSAQLVYDEATSIQGWDLPALDSWPGAHTSTPTDHEWGTAPSTQPRADPGVHSVIWNPSPWHIAGVATTPASAVGAEHDGSPRSMKRRRTEPTLNTHVPIPSNW